MKFRNLPLFIFILLFTFPFQSTAQVTLKKANKEYELHAFNLAIKSYGKILEKDNDNLEALSKIADCYRHLNRIDDALVYYKQAAENEKMAPEHMLGFAKSLVAKGSYETAKKWFEIYAKYNKFVGKHFMESCDFAVSMQGLPAFYRVKNEYANSDASDFGATFFNNKIIYASARSDIKREELEKSSASWTGLSKNQLFITSLDNNRFLNKPTFLRSDLRNTYSEGPLSYSANGSLVAFTKNNFVDGTRQIPSSGIETSIYLAEPDVNGDWDEEVPFAFNGSGYSSGFPSLSADGSIMYFASNRPDGYGGWDIYVSYKSGNSWTTPENVGPVVNSEGNEMTPFFDGEDLYFASDWHHGYGGMDIFRATQTQEGWSKVFHMGNGINSPRDDYGYVFNKQMNIGYFNSNRPGGKGKEDIYQVSKRSDKIVIQVKNSIDKSPVEGATLDFSACGEAYFQTDETGQYSFQALAGLDCEVVASKSGYSPYNFKVMASGKKETMNIEVLLSKESDNYLGKIINATNNAAVTEVFVRATDQGSGNTIETYSNAQGDYKLPLRPNTTYLIRYSKAGFLETHNRINMTDGSDRSVLGIIPFNPSTTRVSKNVSTSIAGTATVGSSTGSVSNLAPNQKGFAIQLAAVYGNEQLNPSEYASLDGLGNLYTKPENGYRKVRLGIFESKDQAEQAKQAIKSAGFVNSFIIAENLENFEGVEIIEPVAATEVNIPDEIPTSASIPIPIKTAGLVDEEPVSMYKVRLAAYKNPKFFQEDKVEGYGTVEKKTKGEFTIMLLSGFASLEDAISAKEKAVASGFKSAYVVLDKDGNMKKVN